MLTLNWVNLASISILEKVKDHKGQKYYCFNGHYNVSFLKSIFATHLINVQHTPAEKKKKLKASASVKWVLKWEEDIPFTTNT